MIELFQAYIRSNIFQMENRISSMFLILLCLTSLSTATTNYFQGLNINPFLLSNANSAIVDLKNTLTIYLDCYDQNRNAIRRSGNLRGSYFVQQRQDKKLRRLRYSNNFVYTTPNIKFATSKRAIAINLYKKVSLVAALLLQIKTYIVQYNNVVIGNNNTLSGNGNVVIGSQNNLSGNNVWVFAQDYKSTNPKDGVLIIQVFLIELADIVDILTDPFRVVSCLNQRDSNYHFQSLWNGADNRHRATF